MPRITAIEPQRRASRVSIFLDGEFALGVDEAVAQALGLSVGREMDLESLSEVVRAETRRRAKESALRGLASRARSRTEIRRSLERKGYESDLIEEVLGELERLDFIDDGQFTRAWVEARTVGRPMGARRIAHELRQKGVSSEIIEAALEERTAPEGELALALTAGRQAVKRLRGQERAVARRKLAAALGRRGFSWSVVSLALDQLLPPEAEGEE
jgi:regulatory protein